MPTSVPSMLAPLSVRLDAQQARYELLQPLMPSPPAQERSKTDNDDPMPYPEPALESETETEQTPIVYLTRARRVPHGAYEPSASTKPAAKRQRASTGKSNHQRVKEKLALARKSASAGNIAATVPPAGSGTPSAAATGDDKENDSAKTTTTAAARPSNHQKRRLPYRRLHLFVGSSPPQNPPPPPFSPPSPPTPTPGCDRASRFATDQDHVFEAQAINIVAMYRAGKGASWDLIGGMQRVFERAPRGRARMMVARQRMELARELERWEGNAKSAAYLEEAKRGLSLLSCYGQTKAARAIAM